MTDLRIIFIGAPETAAHLVDHVFPPPPVRQWVLG
jgi:hypothetical protein